MTRADGEAVREGGRERVGCLRFSRSTGGAGRSLERARFMILIRDCDSKLQFSMNH